MKVSAATLAFKYNGVGQSNMLTPDPSSPALYTTPPD